MTRSPEHAPQGAAERLTDRIAATTRDLEHTCLHFRPLIHKTCMAGVFYWTEGPQPCLLDYDTGKHICPHRCFPSEEVARGMAETYERELDQAMADWHARRNARQCVSCGRGYMRLHQVGPCVYAEPCGHRQWQGTITKEEAHP